VLVKEVMPNFWELKTQKSEVQSKKNAEEY